MLISFIRTIILYIAVVVSLRFMGKKQIGQLQPSELVIAMMISDLASIPMESLGTPLLYGIIPTVTLIIAETTASYLTLKSKRMRKLITGKPTVLIEKGRILRDEMEKLRFDINDLMEQLRVAGYANIFDVDYAIMETNGMLSVIPKSAKRAVTVEDLDLEVKDEGLPLIVISDGKIANRALKNSVYDEASLKKELKKQYGTDDFSKIFIAVCDDRGKLYIQKFHDDTR